MQEGQLVECFLARLYTDRTFQLNFLDEPYHFATRFGLSETEAKNIANIDKVGLELAFKSLEAKRKQFYKKPLKYRSFYSFFQRIKF
jgi:hypothetical protein